MIPSHSALYVVSDLHLGDDPERSIFQDTGRLAATIRALTSERSDGDVALVLAGDVVDFLAEAPQKRFDPEGAAAKLDTIARNYAPVFEALRAFTATPGRTLVVLNGNHDVELALPPVMARLIAHLAGSDAASRGRVHLALNGEGYRADVGGRSVLVVHGNEVDTWNIVDHEAVRRAGAAMQRGTTVPLWEANPGSALVVDVMNDVKRRYPFVDMLKPEDESLLAVLVALDRGVLKRLAKLPGVAERFPSALLRRWGWLGDEGGDGVPDDRAAVPVRTKEEREQQEDALLREALSLTKADVRPHEVLDASGTLGFGSTVAHAIFSGEPDVEKLREAMRDWVIESRPGMELGVEDSTARRLAQSVGPEVDVLIAGHTHIRRARVRSGERNEARWYFNSGTWITLFDLRPPHFESREAFEPVWNALRNGQTPRALLAAKEPIVKRCATVVAVRRQGPQVTAALYDPDAHGGLTPASSIATFAARDGGAR